VSLSFDILQSGSTAAVSTGIDIASQVQTIKSSGEPGAPFAAVVRDFWTLIFSFRSKLPGARVILLAVFQTQGAEVWDAVREWLCSLASFLRYLTVLFDQSCWGSPSVNGVAMCS
jgi:hypothetical protein